MSLFFYIYLFHFYLEGHDRGRDLPFTGSLPRRLQQPRLDQAEARNLEHIPGVPSGWQEAKCLSCLPARVPMSRKLDQKQG